MLEERLLQRAQRLRLCRSQPLDRADGGAVNLAKRHKT